MLVRTYPGPLLGEFGNTRLLLPIRVRFRYLHRVSQHRLKRKVTRPNKAERRQAALELRRREASRRNREEREWLQHGRDALRDDMLRQYVVERQQTKWRHQPETVEASRYQQKQRRYDDDIQCGIFWDIENVNVQHEYGPDPERLD